MLEVTALRKNFAGVAALRGVDLRVQPGECVALIGPNGAGKSTTFACLAGQLQPTAGRVQWCGEDITALTPRQRLQRGIARTFQVAQIFEALTVWQNLALILQVRHGLPAWRRLVPAGAGRGNADARDTLDARVSGLLCQVGLEPLAAVRAASLAYGDRKRLELAIALGGIADESRPMVAALAPVPPLARKAPATPQAPLAAAAAGSPRLLLLDEPAAGLAPDERQQLMAMVRALVRTAPATAPLAVLYTEHNMDAVFGVADRVLVLLDGTMLAQGSAAEVAQDPLVRQRYLGSTVLAALAQESGHA